MTNTGAPAASSSANVRTEPSATQPRGHAGAPRASQDATVKTPVHWEPTGWAVGRGASVGREDPAIRKQESVHVGTDSPAPCK